MFKENLKVLAFFVAIIAVMAGFYLLSSPTMAAFRP